MAPLAGLRRGDGVVLVDMVVDDANRRVDVGATHAPSLVRRVAIKCSVVAGLYAAIDDLADKRRCRAGDDRVCRILICNVHRTPTFMGYLDVSSRCSEAETLGNRI